MMPPQTTLRIWRGDAEQAKFVDYSTVAEEGEVVLDVILRIQATEANDLAVALETARRASAAHAAPRSTVGHVCCA